MAVEELSVTFDDVSGPLSQQVLEDRIEEIVEEPLNYRDVFRDYPAGNIESDRVGIPIPKDEIGDPKVVGEGSEFPRDQEQYKQETLEFDKYGFEIPITMEAQADSQVNLVQDQVDRQARQMRERMNSEAFDVLDSNVVSTVGDANGTMTFDDVLSGRETLMNSNYMPDTLILDTSASHDLLGENNFLEATEEQAAMRRSGNLGEVAGFQAIEDSSSNDITGNSNPGAFLVDTDFYGYEGERTPITTEQYEERSTQTDVFRIFSRFGWLVTDSNAAVRIEG